MSLPAPFVQSFADVNAELSSAECVVLRSACTEEFVFALHTWKNSSWESVDKKLSFDIQEEQIWHLDKDWRVWSECGFIFAPQGKIVLDGFSFPYPNEAVQHMKYCFRKGKPENHRHLEGTVFVFTNVGYNNYFHVVSELFPRLEVIESDANAKILVMQDSPAFVYEGLEMLGFTRDRIIDQRPDTTYSADKLITTNFGLNFIPSKFQWLRNRLKLNWQHISKSKLYIHRAAGMKRSSLSQDFTRIFESHGFEVLKTENLSLANQIQKSRNAEVIAGIHGAGLTNAMWMPNPKIFEIRPKNFDNRCYLHLALALGASDFYLMEVDAKGEDQILIIDETEIENALQSL